MTCLARSWRSAILPVTTLSLAAPTHSTRQVALFAGGVAGVTRLRKRPEIFSWLKRSPASTCVVWARSYDACANAA